MGTAYKCTKCGAKDYDRGPAEKSPRQLNCWKCKAGMGVDPQQMHANRVGMFPLPAEG